MRRLVVAACMTWLSLGCDPAPMDDAGPDGAIDAGRDAGPVDANAPVCTPACGVNETCCETFVTETDVCADLRNDPTHCGSCATDCLTTNRGDACRNSQCACGDVTLGCLGTRSSFCCPPREAGGTRYCANLDQSPADCGACDAGCDPRRSDRCDGGRCQCGPDRGQCDGTPESTCCADGADIGCVDTTTDTFHCGGCNVLCQGGERCEEGTCVRGDACAGGCELGEVCCDGACCERRRCIANVCGGPDGGALPDGGVDGGVDGGADDGGAALDGGADAGGLDASG